MSQSQTQTSSLAAPRPPGAALGWTRPLVEAYKPLPGAFDELKRPDGTLRAPWDRFFGELGRMEPGQFAESLAAADRHLRDSGVFYRVYDDPTGAERPWPLSPLPLMLSSSEWARLSKAVIQRARLAEAVLRDVYGPGKLVRNGVLPAAAVSGSPDFLRPLVGVPPAGGRHLRLYAVDIGRGPDGDWWVLSDRTQAPSGAGYALENRLALSRALPDIARSLNVERLASFFQTFRDELSHLNARAEARVALLTPGPLNETYFEHAYLARYLGFLLVEGADLTVRDGAAYVRTVSGLKRVDVIWRRLDGDFADPLELRASSRLGVPGLVQAVREGEVISANAFGSGMMEARALMGFMPALARHVLGEDLALPNLATWWCGQPRERTYVAENLDRLALAPAFEPKLAALGGARTAVGAGLSPADRAHLTTLIERRGMDLVGQELVKLSTTPVWVDGRIEPRPFVLRLFLAAVGDDDWTVMPGGFCRISGSTDPRFVSLQEGASVSDVWVLSDAPVPETSLLPRPDKVRLRRTTGTLPSRAADNLFWLARYLERTEGTLRLTRALLGRVVDPGAGNEPIVGTLIDMLVSAGALPVQKGPRQSPAQLAVSVFTDGRAIGGLPALTGMARNAAAVIRDRLAPDAFQAVGQIARDFEALSGRRLPPATALDIANAALRHVAAFAGLASENMNRAMGWRFLELGRRIERAAATARFARKLADDAAPQGALDLMLELGDSQITYRTRYVTTAMRHPVLDLLVLDEGNPRSVAFQTARIVEHLETLPMTVIDGRPVALIRMARRLLGSLSITTVEEMPLARLDEVVNDLYLLSEAIGQRFFTQGVSSELPEDLA